jgi:hypothetical protein
MFQMRFGYYWSRICLGKADNGVELPGTTGNSSMRCFGFCVQVRHGAIFPVIHNFVSRFGSGLARTLRNARIDMAALPDYDIVCLYLRIHLD